MSLSLVPILNFDTLYRLLSNAAQSYYRSVYVHENDASDLTPEWESGTTNKPMVLMRPVQEHQKRRQTPWQVYPPRPRQWSSSSFTSALFSLVNSLFLTPERPQLHIEENLCL